MWTRRRKMASLLDLIAAMRAAAVSSVVIGNQGSPTSRTTWYMVCSDFPAAFRTDDAVFDRIVGYQTIAGLVRYQVSLSRVPTIPYRSDAGRNLWPLGTIGIQPIATSSSSQIRYLTFNVLYSPKPLDIQSFTAPTDGTLPTAYFTASEVASLKSTITTLRMTITDLRADLAAVAAALKAAASRTAMLERVAALTAAAERAGRIVYTHRLRSIRIGRY